jgi:AraC family transcriptional regulator
MKFPVPKIVHANKRLLVGLSQKMSLVNNTTAQLWQQFGPQVKTIQNRHGTDKISLQVYSHTYFESFSPENEFVKWALVEVYGFDEVPENLESFQLEAGNFAVFQYKGSSSDTRIFEYIYGTWLPSSGYELADRPHFEVIGSNYKNNEPTSEEEIWIPIQSVK